ncbi:hypothetical protein QJ854_gp309 [Moumouvirus goulette]|uniref:Repeat protein n=1 Tax=Moumouvirus goulette TaxID=1247379 RepID=M1PHC6_9VIRU|nr:hypothetical protein QJ854_gp309 [Moumouvirus goulette]AGF85473.1 hypothetical protein glt_00665 [Moumouvirus goulette]
MSGNNIDLDSLKKNLQELNYLSQNLLEEMNRRNKILEKGINDCRKLRIIQVNQ